MKSAGRLLIACVLCGAAVARAVTPEAVDAAIRKGVAYLYAQQNKDGNWEQFPTRPVDIGMGTGADEGQWGGRTALCTYALLAAGERPLDPRVSKAVEWLRNAPIVGNYALGVRANVWFYLPETKANLAAMTKDAALLARGRANSTRAPNFAFFDYLPGGGRIDLSCSQYGVLGCWAASQRIKAFDRNFWPAIENSWNAQQNDDGGWGYNGRGTTSTLQMTSAGVATLFITQELAHLDDGTDPQQAAKSKVVADGIERGMAFIAQGLPEHLKDPYYYTLYGIERVGVAGGYKYIGDVDWYKECTDAIVIRQNANGSWGSLTNFDNDIDGSFALLFLARGRAPIMVNKLQFDIAAKRSTTTRPADWNLKPRDMANVTRWVEERTERRLNWQIVKLSVAPVDDLHDAPLLYLSGRLPVSLTDDDKTKLRQYVEEGGIIVANADGNSPVFAKTLRTLGEELFPGEKFKPLDPKDGHVLLTGEQFPTVSQKRPVRVEGIDNGARLLMLLVPDGDLSGVFQRRDTTRESAYQFIANAYLYAIEKTARPIKGITHIVRPDPDIHPTKTASVARLQFDGQWNPEPGGWRRLAAVLHNQSDIDLKIRTVASGNAIGAATIAHLTGTGVFTLTDPERAAIKAYLAAGGLLLVDACGGDAAFDVSARAELAKLVPDAESQLLTPLPADHALFTGEDKKPIEAKYRDFAVTTQSGSRPKDLSTFALRGLTLNGKLAILYSPQDLSEGLVGQPVDGIVGYTPDVATALVRRIIELKADGRLR